MLVESPRESPLTRPLHRLFTVLLCLLIALAVGLGAAAFVPFDLVRHRLDSFAGDGDAAAFTPAIHSRIQTAAGAGVLILGILAVVVARLRSPGHLPGCAVFLEQLLQDGLRNLHGLRDRVMVGRWWILLLILIALAVRCPFCSQPVRYDEAHTYIRYASRPLPFILVEYDEPNNHVLHSLCLGICTGISGDSEAVIRLTALVAGSLLPVAVLILMLGWQRPVVAGAAGMLTAVMPVLVFYSVNARGYTLGSLLILIAAIAAGPALRRASFSGWVTVAIALALAMWTIPTMVYGTIALLASLMVMSWSVSHRARAVRQILLTALATAGLTLTLYLPIILTGGMDQLNRVSADPDQAGGIHMLLRLLSDGCIWAGQGIPVWCRLLMGGFLLAGLFSLLRSAETRGCLAGPLTIPAILLVQGVLPPERTWCFLLPFAAILVVTGIDRVGRAAGAVQRQWAWVLTVSISVSVVLGVQLLRGDYIRTNAETGYFPEGRAVAEWLKAEVFEREPVLAVTPASAVLTYYAGREGMSMEHFMRPGLGWTNDSSAIAVIDRRSGQQLSDVLTELQLSELFPADQATQETVHGQVVVFRLRPLR